MTVDVEWLTSDEGREIIGEAADLTATPSDVQRLRNLHPQVAVDLIGSAIHQSLLRRKAALRWRESTTLLLTSDGLEQATRPTVARWRARYLTSLIGDGRNIIDLTCGLGVDAVAFAQEGHSVTAVERDDQTARIAAWNLKGLAKMHCADAESFPIPNDTDAVFIDPARRDTKVRTHSGDAKRSLNPRNWSPSWDFVRGLMGHTYAVMAKVAPGIADEHLDDVNVDFVSDNGDLVEACVTWLSDADNHVTRRAVLLDDEHELVIDGGRTTNTHPPGTYLVAPVPALVRARALTYVADKLHGGLVHPDIAWLTTNDATAAREVAHARPTLAQVFVVEHWLAFQRKQLKALVAQTPCSALTVMTRGTSLDVEDLRKYLAPRVTPGAPELVVAVYRGDEGNQVVLCRRLPTD